MYHYIGSLVPPHGIPPDFMPIYIHDADYLTQVIVIQQVIPDLYSTIIQALTEIFYPVNPYTLSFKIIRE